MKPSHKCKIWGEEDLDRDFQRLILKGKAIIWRLFLWQESKQQTKHCYGTCDENTENIQPWKAIGNGNRVEVDLCSQKREEEQPRLKTH